MFRNQSARELNFRVVVLHPQPESCRSTLVQIHERLPAAARGARLLAASGSEQTLFFDFVPPGLGEIHGYRLRLHLYGIIGEITPAAIARIFRGIDGLVFLAPDESLEALAERTLVAQNRRWDEVPIVSASNEDPFGMLKEITKRLLLALAADRIEEQTASPEENRSALDFVCRARIIGHYGEHFGETRAEYGPPEPTAGLREIFVVEHGPSADRPYWTYGTAGLSLQPQAAGGPEPRLELLAYAQNREPRVTEVLMELAYQIATASSDDAPYKCFDTVDLTGLGLVSSTFVLVPAPETEALLSFPTADPVNALFNSIVGTASIAFLQVLPVSRGELERANEHGTPALFEELRSRGRKRFEGWGSEL